MLMNHTISENAVVKRIKRKLAHDGESVKTNQTYRPGFRAPRFYVYDVARNWITGQFDDVESYARELGVLQPYEKVESVS